MLAVWGVLGVCRLFDDDNAVIIASGDRGSMGDIISANLGTSKLLGFSRSELVSNNLTTIMPVWCSLSLFSPLVFPFFHSLLY